MSRRRSTMTSDRGSRLGILLENSKVHVEGVLAVRVTSSMPLPMFSSLMLIQASCPWVTVGTVDTTLSWRSWNCLTEKVKLWRWISPPDEMTTNVKS
ncbi:MAG: hypothetical protein GWN18_11415 [Thermoplasmata archaeon]|nr:hypothetical protein [Thermoplasmata archaeon]